MAVRGPGKQQPCGAYLLCCVDSSLQQHRLLDAGFEAHAQGRDLLVWRARITAVQQVLLLLLFFTG